MKTRTNQTISLLVVASMVALTTAQINTLSAGDIVLKKDESGYHSYIVSYKKEGTGICLTYNDASCVETVSYDLVDGEWVYNSTDISPILTGDAVLDMLETSDVKAKTLKQSEPNYLFEFEVMVEDDTNFEKVGTQYCRIEEVNGEIHIIILARFHNKDTASAHSTRLAQINITNIPTSISSKIYGYDGVLSEPNAGTIRLAPMGIEGGNLNITPCRLSGANANTMVLYQPSAISCIADGYITFSLEVNLSVV